MSPQPGRAFATRRDLYRGAGCVAASRWWGGGWWLWLLVVVAGVRAVQLLVDPQGAEGWALAFLPAEALHFILLGISLPLLWCRRSRPPKEGDSQP